MLRLFKLLGLGVIFCVCACAGIYKANLLKRRCQRLSEIFKGINTLAEGIRCNGGELQELLPLCFGKETIIIQNGYPEISSEFLLPEDISLINEFFSGFGRQNTPEEYERTRLFASLLEKQCRKAEKSCNELSRLYGTLGILCGAFICIFLF